MEPLHTLHHHPGAEILEEYAFKRLGEAETEALEEHLLVCEKCQASLARLDRFILMMKHASWRDRPAPRIHPTRGWGRGLGYAVATGLAVAGVFISWAAMHPKSISGQAPVELLALRGGAGANRALAHRSMDLRIHLADLPAGRIYRLEMVDAAGRRVWSGEAAASIEGLSAHVGKPLASGQYWVRLYAGSELVREFGLRAE